MKIFILHMKILSEAQGHPFILLCNWIFPISDSSWMSSLRRRSIGKMFEFYSNFFKVLNKNVYFYMIFPE